jgi:hypothetical protein
MPRPAKRGKLLKAKEEEGGGGGIKITGGKTKK